MLEFGKGHIINQAVAPGITRPLHAPGIVINTELCDHHQRYPEREMLTRGRVRSIPSTETRSLFWEWCEMDVSCACV